MMQRVQRHHGIPRCEGEPWFIPNYRRIQTHIVEKRQILRKSRRFSSQSVSLS